MSIGIDQLGDPRWRLSNLYFIINKEGSRVKFEPNSAQQQFIEGIHSRNLILKARQLGFTTLCCLLYLDDCLFTPDVRAAVIAHKLDDAKTIFRDKVKYPYDNLPEGLKEAIGLKQASADTLTFGNDSSIRVTTSTRSGTVNWLHVSEYGKICAQFPEKAREIKTGAFPSAEKGIVTIESTAEGQEGDFFAKSQEAEANAGKELSRLDYKFFFFPWHQNPDYQIPQSVTPEGEEDRKYFARVEAEAKTRITPEQRHWWLAQERDLGGDMKREYPATPREAFEQAIEGAYFADQIATAEKHGRIGRYPIDPALPVNTFWDLGRNDMNCIWLQQDWGNLSVFVGYYENSGEWIGHYIDWLNKWREDMGVQFGTHYLPHDGDREILWVEGDTKNVMAKLGFRPNIVKRNPNKIEQINTARRKFQMCAWDEANCKQGIKRLKHYRKQWNDALGVWRDKPLHDENSNGADAYMTFSDSNHTALPKHSQPVRDRYRQTGKRSGGSWMAA
ncbi:terminase [Pseudohoeflea coraliihabitans]|uniref:Terminase n=1 Tax=Pseudohoeflea coraliihabitans TaxID=2860393 RepID=A0ABS6WVV1_9HYPH|nr:terminase [Pseudohoeflea sp. DP4N28-3]MBW3099224.1 terminase [Pseudohoeflea sp. DP4N28-3]